VGRTDDALVASLRAHELAERATLDHPGDLTAARTRLWVSAQAGFLVQTKGQSDQARHLCEQAIAFGKARVREHPRDVEMRLHLAWLEMLLGELEKSQGHPLEALKIERSAADALGALAHENPLLIQVRAKWAEMLFGVSNLQADLGRSAEAEQSVRASIEANEVLMREVPSNPFYRRRAGSCYGTLGKVLLKTGSRGEGLAMMRKGEAILETSDEPWDLYNLACFLALASTVADPAEGSAATQRQRRDSDQAVATIRRAIARGYAHSDYLKTDPDLDSLRSRPDFQLLMMDLTFPAEPFSKNTDAASR
jgi:tetratricopeptide (TPR) repeat protein